MSPLSSPVCFMCPYLKWWRIALSPWLFTSKPSHPIRMSSISPHHQVQTVQTCSTSSVHMLLQHLTQSFIGARNGLFSRYIVRPDKYLILLLSRYPSSRCSLVLLQGLVGIRIQHDFTSAWCHFSSAAWAGRGKGKKRKDTVSKNRTEECKLHVIHQEREEECVSSYLQLVWAERVGRREFTKRWSVAPTSGIP